MLFCFPQLKKKTGESDMKLLLSIEQQALVQTLLKIIAEHQVAGRMGQVKKYSYYIFLDPSINKHLN